MDNNRQIIRNLNLNNKEEQVICIKYLLESLYKKEEDSLSFLKKKFEYLGYEYHNKTKKEEIIIFETIVENFLNYYDYKLSIQSEKFFITDFLLPIIENNLINDCRNFIIKNNLP